ncbi:MAG: NAD(P)-dependent oxidoreductase [Deltaproteobacteria bacterium]|nr:MAG: NAD(P)-dependent oxidoreductase [Deltaproteobacteria bacterium]
MNFLITGGAGSVGQDLTASLLREGHRVRVLDKQAETVSPLQDMKLEWIQGRLEEARVVQRALQGVDTVIHLAWSFSDDPAELLEGDLKGHVVLLDACVAAKVSRLFYASSAVVYGKPVHVPITEDAPCLVEDARKPFYAVAKLTAEKLALTYGKMKGLPVMVFRFWWSYGKKIGGRHLREMIKLAQAGQPLMVPDGAGGSFLDHDDLAHALLLAVQRQESIGQIFNLATIYLEWRDIARMIIQTTDSSSSLEVIPAREWKGAQFLADSWELSIAKAERLFDFRSLLSPATARQRLEKAIAGS